MTERQSTFKELQNASLLEELAVQDRKYIKLYLRQSQDKKDMAGSKRKKAFLDLARVEQADFMTCVEWIKLMRHGSTMHRDIQRARAIFLREPEPVTHRNRLAFFNAREPKSHTKT